MMKLDLFNNLSNDKCKLLILTLQYMLIKDRDDEIALNAWRERVKEQYPYSKNAMLATIRDIVEMKGRRKSA